MEQGDDGGKRWGIIGIIGSCIVGLHKASVTTTRATQGKQPHLGGRSHLATPNGDCRQKILALKRVLSKISGLANHLCLKWRWRGTLLVGRCSSWGVLRFGGCQ